MRRRAFAVALAVATLGACGGSGGYDREDAAVATGRNGRTLIAAAAEAAADFAAQASALCAQPDRDRKAALDALRNARTAWRRSEVFWFGPVTKRLANAKVDWFVKPDDVARIHRTATPPALNAETVGALGSDSRGFGAAELLLAAPELNERGCAFLTGIAEVAAREERAVRTAWSRRFMNGAGFAAQLGENSMMAIDYVVNSVLDTLNRISAREIGLAIGEVGISKEPEPLLLQEGPSGWGADDVRARLDGIGVALFGTTDEDGLAPLLGDELVATVRKQFAAAVAAGEAIRQPLRAAVRENLAALSSLRATLVELEKTIATEVVLRLGVTVGFSDADGDSAG